MYIKLITSFNVEQLVKFYLHENNQNIALHAKFVLWVQQFEAFRNKAIVMYNKLIIQFVFDLWLCALGVCGSILSKHIIIDNAYNPYILECVDCIQG